MYTPHRGNLFGEGSISTEIEKQYNLIDNAINSASENEILNFNEQQFIDYHEERLKFEIPAIHFEGVHVESRTEKAEVKHIYYHGSSYYDDKIIDVDIYRYIIPCTGSVRLLRFCPANTITLGGGGNFTVNETHIYCEFIKRSDDPEEIKKLYNTEVAGIERNFGTLIRDIQSYNESLASVIQSRFQHRKNKILTRNNFMSALEVPIKKNPNISPTFSIPRPSLRKQINIIKPQVLEKGYKAEPTLEMADYMDILKIINDVGRNFERMPDTYKNKHEEDLRDHILLTLDPNFQYGNAAGETFNRGNTDISLRYDSGVVFIAECKIWRGEKGYLDTISQLLGYLTWRDTKAAIIIFLKQKDISSVLSKIELKTKEHANFIGFVNKSDENWFNYRFHINGDRNREVKLAVMLYHMP